MVEVAGKIRRDFKVLSVFIAIYCEKHHENRAPVAPNLGKIEFFAPKPLSLCPACTRLLMHAMVKRLHCPMTPKPACKRCPNHCYHPTYRKAIRQVMQFSGRHMLLRGRLDYLLHLLF